jgi:hypothetical protein
VQLNPEDPNLEIAVFGAEVEQFLDSSIGQYLIKHAESQANSALEALASVSAEDPTAIRELQNRVKVADSIVGWLREAIILGRQAEDQLSTLQ